MRDHRLRLNLKIATLLAFAILLTGLIFSQPVLQLAAILLLVLFIFPRLIYTLFIQNREELPGGSYLNEYFQPERAWNEDRYSDEFYLEDSAGPSAYPLTRAMREAEEVARRAYERLYRQSQ